MSGPNQTNTPAGSRLLIPRKVELSAKDIREFRERSIHPTSFPTVLNAEMGNWALVVAGLPQSQGTIRAFFPGEATVPKDLPDWLTVTQHAVDTGPSQIYRVAVEVALEHGEIMDHLLSYITGRLASQESNIGTIEQAGVAAAAIKDWMQYFGRTTSVEAGFRYQGALGELLVLREMVQCYGARAVNWWTGPGRASQDFRSENGEEFRDGITLLEVKTVRATGADTVPVSIHGEGQLSGPGALVVVALESTESVGVSVESTKAEVEALLGEDEAARQAFADKFKGVGLDEANEEYRTKYTVAYCREWRFDSLPQVKVTNNESYPVSGVSYTVTLSGGEKRCLGDLFKDSRGAL